ncbi:MAG: class I SAM-dependent methyltransferase [Phycisphaerae bacterium]
MTQTANRQSIEGFDRWSVRYDNGRITGFFREMQALVIDKMALGPSARLLDVGCGTGWAVEHATRNGGAAHGVGIDLSGGMIARAQRERGHLPRVSYARADAEALPFADNTFDAAMCTFSFHHYSSPVKALAGIRRVLKPGGAFYVLDNNRASFLGLYALWDVYFRWFEPGHVRYLTSPELSALFTEAGFSDTKTIYERDRLFHGKKIFGSAMIVRGMK